MSVLILVSCTNDPDPDEVTGGPPPTPVDSFGVTDTTGGQASTDNSLIDTEPVVVAALEGILGWWDGGAWVPPVEPPPLAGGETFQILTVGSPPEPRTGGAVGRGCEFNEGSHGVDLGWELPPIWPAPMPIGVTPPAWDLVPHPIEPLEAVSTEDLAYVGDVLADLGIDDANPQIVQAIRTDLEGDGAEELLLVAERMSTGFLTPAADGDYSVALVRRTSAGATITAVLGEHLVATSGPDEPPVLFAFRYAALADLNGDGRMEIVIDTQYHEGSSVEVFDYTESGPVFTIGADCGV